MIIFLVLSLVTFAANGIVTAQGSGAWYRSLKKPVFNPPDWIFAPAWAVLFILMALAASRVRQETGWASLPIVLYLVHLLFNVGWSALFFTARRIGIALGEIIILWVMVLALVLLFGQVDTTAMLMMLPYLVWVTFAAMLNFELWRLNRQAPVTPARAIPADMSENPGVFLRIFNRILTGLR